MSIEKLRPSFAFTEDRLRELQAVVPEAFADGKINWDTLREALGEYLEEEGDEHFGLFWPGKREARRLAAMPSKGTLIPQPGEGVDEENTHNIFIEGDNLEILKILQKSYTGRVKMIYIDPPYNTGNDYIYSDNYTEPLENYLKQTGQSNEAGILLTTNTKTNGRFHTNWLNMMLPRIRLAWDLLSNDGVIFISIDDNEVANLRIFVNEIFGEENFVGSISRVTKTTSDAGDYFAPSIDYVLVYAKSLLSLNNFRKDLTDKDITAYNKEDKFGKYKSVGFYQASLTLERSRNARYYILCPDGSKCIPPENKRWRCIEPTFFELLEKDEIEFIRVKNSPLIDEFGRQSIWNVYTKQYLNRRLSEGKIPRNFIDDIQNVFGTKELKELDIPFSFPKPSKLVKYLSQICQLNSGEITLDFFAGSATTAQAILESNEEDGGRRKFILIQIPELTEEGSEEYKRGFINIAEIGKERIRRVISQINANRSRKSSQNVDLGFLVYKLDQSGFKQWKQVDNLKQLEMNLESSIDPIIIGRQPNQLLIEILLLQGFPLDSDRRQLLECKSNSVFEISSKFCNHNLFVCLDKTIYPDTVTILRIKEEDIFVCFDSALTDEQKIAFSDKTNLRVI